MADQIKDQDKYGGKGKMSSGVDQKKRVTPGTNEVHGSKKIGPKGEGLHQPETGAPFKDRPNDEIGA
jgi:hypothetical protein